MFDDLPNLNALRAFEAVARHMSFKEAASSLYVTPGAVSQQVKALEEELGVQLIRRSKRNLSLTEAGRMLYPVARDAFERLSEATGRIKESDKTGPLTVSVLPSFAAKWLVPRMGRFREAHPEIDLRISASLHKVDFVKEDVDIAIRYGPGKGEGLWTRHLMEEYLLPVCAPTLMEGPHALTTPEDLRHHTLLHDEGPRDWRFWLETFGVKGVDYTKGPVLNDAAMVLQAAIAGQGVAISRYSLVNEDLAAGRLVKPFDLDLKSDWFYYVVCPIEYAERPKITAFVAWLFEEAGRV